MIAKQLANMAHEGLTTIHDRQAEQTADFVAGIQTSEQLEAAKYLSDAQNRSMALKVSGATIALLGATAGAVFIANKTIDTAHNTLDSVGTYLAGLLPHQSADFQINSYLHSLEYPKTLQLEKASGVATPQITTHDRLFGINYAGSEGKVKEVIDVSLSIPHKYVSYKAVEATVLNDKNELTKEWRLQATVVTDQPAATSTHKHDTSSTNSTFEYTPEIGKISDQVSQDSIIRRLGQVVVGSDTDTRLQITTNLGKGSFANACAPVIKAVIPQAFTQAIKQEFASARAVQGIAGMPKNIADNIEQMVSNPPIVVFRHFDRSPVTPEDIQIPVAAVESKKSIARELGMATRDITITTDKTCAMDQNVLDQFTHLSGQGN